MACGRRCGDACSVLTSLAQRLFGNSEQPHETFRRAHRACTPEWGVHQHAHACMCPSRGANNSCLWWPEGAAPACDQMPTLRPPCSGGHQVRRSLFSGLRNSEWLAEQEHASARQKPCKVGRTQAMFTNSSSTAHVTDAAHTALAGIHPARILTYATRRQTPPFTSTTRTCWSRGLSSSTTKAAVRLAVGCARIVCAAHRRRPCPFTWVASIARVTP